MREERLLAFLERDGIHDALALDALEAGLDDGPLRRVDHHRHARDVGLGGDEIQEAHHGGFRIEHALVHVHVDDLRAVLHLLARDGQRGRIVVGLDELAELGRAGDVGAFAHVHEADVVGEIEGFEARELRRGTCSFFWRTGSQRTRSAIARMWSGVVPQQPPTRFRWPDARARRARWRCLPALRRIHRRHWAGRRSDTRRRWYRRGATALRRRDAAV